MEYDNYHKQQDHYYSADNREETEEDSRRFQIYLQSKVLSSPIWNHVEKMKDKNILRCLYCQNEYKVDGNTTNMLKHLKSQHPLFFGASKENVTSKAVKRPIENNTEPEASKTNKQKRQATVVYKPGGIVDTFKRINSFEDGGFMSDKISNTILYMICTDMLPLSIVEFEGFRVSLKLLAPLYKTPSKKTITRKLESRYILIKKAFIKGLETVPYYCITADNWTDCSTQSYIGLTIHYLHNSVKIKSRYLGCFPLYDRHTSEYLKNSIQEVFDEVKIAKEKITAIITDSEAAIKKACIELVGKDKHLICIAHVVAHLLPEVLNNFTEIKIIFDKVKSIVTLMKRSIAASDKLKELQDGKSEGSALKLKQDVPTRWTTKIDMLERYIELESYIYVAMEHCQNPIDLVNREEMKVLKDVLPIMEPIRTVITEISGDSYPTLSLIIPIIHCMEQKIESITTKTEIGYKFKMKLQSAMTNRFEGFEYCSLLSTSTILDPRYKKIHFKEPLSVSNALSQIRKKIDEVKPTEDSSKEPVSEKSNSSSIWDFHDIMLKSTSSQLESTIKQSVELDQYLKLPLISRKENIFMYWKNAEMSFPILSQLALRKLPIIATSVPSERVF